MEINISKVDLEKSLTLAKEVAVLAGLEILKIYDSGVVEQRSKADNSPVTQADMAANKIITDELTKKSLYQILSEEGAPKTLDPNETYWIIDPMDGTKNFIKRDGEFSVMLGLLHKGSPVLGVVYVPVTKKLFYATKGFGAYVLDDFSLTKKLHSNRGKKIADCVALLSKNHLKPAETSFVESLKIKNTKQIGSCGIKLAAIASGEADLYANMDGLSVWDICGPAAILLEAGGSLYDKSGLPLNYTNQLRLTNGIIATNGDTNIDRQIKEKLQTHKHS